MLDQKIPSICSEGEFCERNCWVHSDDLKDELAVREESGNLEALLGLATHLDNRLRERRRQRTSERALRSSGSVSGLRGVPMDSSAPVPVPAHEVPPCEPVSHTPLGSGDGVCSFPGGLGRG